MARGAQDELAALDEDMAEELAPLKEALERAVSRKNDAIALTEQFEDEVPRRRRRRSRQLCWERWGGRGAAHTAEAMAHCAWRRLGAASALYASAGVPGNVLSCECAELQRSYQPGGEILAQGAQPDL